MPASPANAASATTTDPLGDNSADYAKGDVVEYSVANDGSTITMTAKVAKFANPQTDPAWVNRFSYVAFFVWANDDSHLIWMYNTGSGVIAESYDSDCNATPSWDAAKRTYTARVPSSCLGNPEYVALSITMAYEGDDGLGIDEVGPSPWVSALDDDGYWMVTKDGTVYGFGGAVHYGGAWGVEVVDIEPTPSGNGYWLLTNTGEVFTYGDAEYFGRADLFDGERATAISRTPSGDGYWVFTNIGRAVGFGNAVWFGDMVGTPLNGPVLDAIPTPTGNGYYMVGSDGGIFSFGDAAFFGSMGGQPLNAPVMSLVPDPDGSGYWLVALDGGVFAFDAGFRGSMGGMPLNKPITGMVPFGNGYLMVGEDGGIFNFSDKPFLGSLGSNPPDSPIVSVAVA